MIDLKHKVANDLGLNKTLNLIDFESTGKAFETEKKDADAGFRKTKNKYRVLSVKMRNTIFTNEELKSLVKKYETAVESFGEHQGQLVDKVLEIVSSYHPLLESVCGTIAKLDVLSSFAEVSSMYNYTKPEIHVDP